MKVYLVNAEYSWETDKVIGRVSKNVFSSYEKALEKVKALIEEDKRTIDYKAKYTIEEKTENVGHGITRFWLYWNSYGRCSHCWEIHEVTVE